MSTARWVLANLYNLDFWHGLMLNAKICFMNHEFAALIKILVTFNALLEYVLKKSCTCESAVWFWVFLPLLPHTV